MSTNLTFVDHIAIESKDIAQSAKWYQDQFNCEVKHQDETWALLKFANISLALVTPGEHPPHFAVVDKKIVDDWENKINASLHEQIQNISELTSAQRDEQMNIFKTS